MLRSFDKGPSQECRYVRHEAFPYFADQHALFIDLPAESSSCESCVSLITERSNRVDENRKANKRLEHLEEEQKKTNVLLKEHTRDLLRIANLLEARVVHWGDKVQIGEGKQSSVKGIVSKAA